MEIMIILWIAFAFLTGYIASQKNRSAAAWGIAGLFFGVFAVVAIAAVPSK